MRSPLIVAFDGVRPTPANDHNVESISLGIKRNLGTSLNYPRVIIGSSARTNEPVAQSRSGPREESDVGSPEQADSTSCGRSGTEPRCAPGSNRPRMRAGWLAIARVA